MSTTLDGAYLYQLLPAWIRLRDQTDGAGTLEALLRVIASQAQIVGDDLDQLYDDQFIETCAPWVIPYIGDLIGFRPLSPVGPGQPAASRAEVAHTIHYRRRKGTLGVLEQLAFDLAAWPAIAVEYFTRLATTQYVRNHVRVQDAIVDVRSPVTAVDINSAFDLAPRTLDVRRISSGRGRYNIPNVGVFVWRLRPYSLSSVPALVVGPNRYTFDPLGDDVPLVNRPQPLDFDLALLGRSNVPFFLVRYPLYAELEAWRVAQAAGVPFTPTYFRVPPFVIREPSGDQIDPLRMKICDLSNWTVPTEPGIRVAVDPELGRFVFAATPPHTTDTIRVDYTYAFSGDYGSGAFPHPVAADEAHLESSLPIRVIPDFAVANLSSAHDEVVEIGDSGIHTGDIALSPDAHPLIIRAGAETRPVLRGNLTIAAVAGASCTLRGLSISGRLTVSGPGPFTLRLEYCMLGGPLDWSTLSPGEAGAPPPRLFIDHSLCGVVIAHPDIDVFISDSVLDAGSDAAAALSCGSITMARSTIFGTIACREIPVLECSIATGVVTSARRQEGCVRYSYLPEASLTPPRFRCHPNGSSEATLQPVFTSRTRGQPGYAQLADATPDQIRFGAEDNDEMGVFFTLFGPRRERNLRFRIAEYMRIGLEFNVIHAT